MSGVLQVSTDALRRHARDVEGLADSAREGVRAGAQVSLSGQAFGRMCAFVGAAIAPVQATGVASTAAAVGSLSATAAAVRASADVLDQVDDAVTDALDRLRGSW